MHAHDLLYGNSLKELLTAGGIALGLLAIVWVVRLVARRKLRNADQTETQVDDFLLELADRTKLFLLAIPALHLGGRALDLPEQLSELVENVSSLALIAQSALWVSGLVDFWLRRYRKSRLETDPDAAMTIGAFRLAAVAAVWLLAVITALSTLGFNVGTLIAGLGIGGVAVALATQNILADLFASLSIVIDKPFVIGDSIMVDTMVGTVEHIGLKTTRIRSVTGEQLVVSNGDLLRSRIRNFKRMTERRVLTRIGVVHSTPPDVLERIPLLLRSAVEKQPLTRFDRAHFASFGESAYEFELVYFLETADYGPFMDTQQAVNLDIVRAFAAGKIEFAFPTRTLFVNKV